MIQFGQPLGLYGFAAALILLTGWAWWSERRSRHLLRRFAAGRMMDRLAVTFSRPRQRLKVALSVIASLLLIFALARPQWGSVTEEIELQGVDILFALDTSRSMLAEDYQPNRLERAKLAILDLVSRLEGDRVGLIAFAGDAFLQSPLTLDYSAFLQTLEVMNTETISRGGTNVAEAIEEAMAYFEETDRHHVLVLISDGEDLEASGVRRAREAAAEGITIFTVGVGSPEGELIPLRGPGGEVDFLRDHTGDPVRTRLDEESLRAIAEVGGGAYHRLGRGDGALDEIYSMARAAVDESSTGSLTREIPIERYHWPLGLGLLCIVLEWSIGSRKRIERFLTPVLKQSGDASIHSILISALTLGCLCLAPEPALGSPRQAERSYEGGDFERAIALWTEAAEENPDDPRLRYNLGNAYYRSGQFAAAIDAYQNALPLAEVSLQERIFYNLANAQYQLGSEELSSAPAKTTDLWEEALQNYSNSLAINPHAEDAGRNRTWVEQQFAAHGSRIEVAPSPAEGGETSEGGLFLPGTILELHAEARPGWRFAGWEGAEVKNPEEPQTEMVVQQSARVFALFVETRELEVRSGNPDQGTAGSSGRFDLDQEVPIEAEANDYFAFKQWVSETLEVGDPGAAQTTVKLTDDGSVTAEFTDAFKLDVLSEPAMAGNAGHSGFFERHSQTPIQAEARDGFEWAGWSSEHGEDIADVSAAETQITLRGDRKVVARFERIWNLVVLPDRDEAGSTTGGGNFSIGSIQPIEAEPNEGFTFQRWEGPGVDDPGSASTTVEILSDEQDIIAIFEQEEGDDEEEGEDSSDPESDQDDSESESNDDDSSSDSDSESGDADEEEGSDREEDESEEADNDPAEERPAEEEQVARETPESLTEEEARQLLQLLRQDERQLPLRPRPPSGEEPATGRDW